MAAAALGAAAGWLLAQDAVADEALFVLGACALVVFAFAALAVRRLARRFSVGIARVDGLAKAVLIGARSEAPKDVAIGELAGACERLAHAASAVRSRELALRSAEVTKDEFIAMLGHELRNPLNALYAAAHMLDRAGATEPMARQAGGVVVRQARQMTRLVEDLLDVNRIVRGKVSLSREPMSLSQAAEKALGELRVAGRLARHDVRLDLQEVWVRADAARIEQIVANLVGNAIKYTPEGGHIAVEARRDGDAAVLRVRDDGIGMAVELTSRVFDLFVQAEGAHRRGGGLGIGLTLVRHLAELHGGQAFAASSGPGQGSVFTVSLPAIDARPNEAVAALAPAPRARHRILLVEDNAEARDAMFAALALDGHRVYEASDGEAGLRTIAAVKPDVAVIDIGLPGLDGFEVAAALRESAERERMVLIAMSGFERPDTLRRAREAGFDQYVAKPVSPEALSRLIDAAFFNRSRAAPRDSAFIMKA